MANIENGRPKKNTDQRITRLEEEVKVTEEVIGEAAPDILTTLGVTLLDFGLSGATSVLIPFTVGLGGYWAVRSQKPQLSGLEAERAYKHEETAKQYLTRHRNKSRRRAKINLVSIGVGAGVIGGVRGLLSYLDPEFGKAGILVNAMQNYVLPNFPPEVASAYAHSDKPVINTILLSAVFGITQAGNAFHNVMKTRNYNARLTKMN